MPLVKAEVLIRTGRIFEPEKKVGLGAILANLLRSGGTDLRTSDEIDKRLDQLAIKIAFSMSSRMAKGGLDTLSKNQDEAFKLFFEMLFKPKFDEERLKLAKKRAIEVISRRNETPSSIFRMAF